MKICDKYLNWIFGDCDVEGLLSTLWTFVFITLYILSELEIWLKVFLQICITELCIA